MKLFTDKMAEIDALLEFEQVLQRLPTNIYIETDEDGGKVTFWRRTPKGAASAIQVGEIKCKRKVSL